MADEIDRGALVAAVTAGKAIKDGARVANVRLQVKDEGIVVHLFGDERDELTEALRAILARRVEV